jgi:hypothetical protein
MTGGPLETLDDAAFYDVGDFAVLASVAGDSVAGLFDANVETEDGAIAVSPVFRCRTRYAKGTVMTILATAYKVEAAEPLESGEHTHFLRAV